MVARQLCQLDPSAAWRADVVRYVRFGQFGTPDCARRPVVPAASSADRSDVNRIAGLRASARLFLPHAALSAIPVLVLGLVLGVNYQSEARRRGLADGRSQANLVAQTAVEPVLEGHVLSTGLTPAERDSLDRLSERALGAGTVLRLRVRDLAGRVVFSDDGSGLSGGPPDDEAVEAAGGEAVTQLTRLNRDSNDSGPAGVAAVEAYRLLRAGVPVHPVGVLEVYLPYSPIQHDIGAGLRSLERNVFAGLALLYLVLLTISSSVGRGLRREAARNAFLAHHDTLTELPNRMYFHRQAEAAVATARGSNRSAVIAIIDLDRFKEVNDTLGHPNGDRLLIEVARRLAERTRSGDTVARLGGDEFGVILRDVADPEPLLGRLRAVIDREMEVSGLPLSVEASVGYVVAPDDGDDVDELLQRADVAMYEAKARHAGVMRYERGQDRYDAANLGLVAELRRAIDENALVLHYQPKVRLSDGTVEAVEALVRWAHPVHGLLPPGRFLPLAEQTDLIEPLTDWVLRTALADMATAGLPAGLGVAVNVSARNLSRADFAARVLDVLDASGVAPDRLILEITETALLDDPRGAAGLLATLADRGVRISIDDFGQGHTSLGYLSALPIHELKIDRAFVSDMLTNAGHAAIVRSIVDLGHNLSLRVVGEGVETADTMACLRRIGCDVAQGYLIATPMPFPELAAWLRANAAAGAATRS